MARSFFPYQTPRRVGRATHVAAFFVLLAFVLVSQTATHAAEHNAQDSSASTFQTDQAEHVISFAYHAIQTRYLEPTALSSLALDSLKGLGTLDRGLTTVQNGSALVMRSANHLIATMPVPQDETPQDWARTVVKLTTLARAHSPALRRVGNEKIYQAMFNRVLSHLDPFSRYSGAKKAKTNRESRSGFGGVGIRYRFARHSLTIDDVLHGAPADSAGLKIGDRIIRIGETNVAALGRKRELVRNLLRGPLNSTLRLTVQHDAQTRDIVLKRELVVPRTITVSDISDGIAHIKISGFNHQTSKTLHKAIRALESEGDATLRGIILDMRGNPGGLLDQSIDVSDLFLSQGRIVFTKGRHPEAMQDYVASPGDITHGLPMAVILDGRSASAAEIVGAALQDNGRAIVVGSTSYGKGTVQTVIHLPNGGEMVLTWSRFHSPSGYALHGLGVLPTICIQTKNEPPSEAVAASLSAPMIGRASGGTTGYPFSAYMAEWRHTPLWDTTTRDHLRTLCPPRDQAKWAADIRVAQYLIHNKDLYHRALMATAPQSAHR